MNATSIRISNSATVNTRQNKTGVISAEPGSRATDRKQRGRAESGRRPGTEQGEHFNQTNNSQIGISASVPAVPGRTQRVLINKRQAAKATTTASRLFRKPLAQSGQD